MTGVFQWASGNVGRYAARAVSRRSDMELTGLHVTNPDKSGSSVNDLLGIDAPGVSATSSIEAILDSAAEVVVHAPLASLIYGENPNQDLDDICSLLAGGKNVITVVGYMYPKVYGRDVVDRIETACRAGGTSFHGTGLNPGWMGDWLPLAMSTLCEQIDHLGVLEVSNFQHYASPQIMFESMGFGSTPDAFEARGVRRKTWLDGLFSESIQLVADGLAMNVTTIESTRETVLAENDLEVAAGTVSAGTVAGQRWYWKGLAGGNEVIAHETVWRIHPDVAPDWPDSNNHIRFKGTPDIDLELPRDFTFISNGMLSTAMRAVNAIPYVVAAEPGIRTFLDLPPMFARQSPRSH